MEDKLRVRTTLEAFEQALRRFELAQADVERLARMLQIAEEQRGAALQELQARFAPLKPIVTSIYETVKPYLKTGN